MQFITDPALGAGEIGGYRLADWLPPVRATPVLFAGLFRPVDAVANRLQEAYRTLYPAPMQVGAKLRYQYTYHILMSSSVR